MQFQTSFQCQAQYHVIPGLRTMNCNDELYNNDTRGQREVGGGSPTTENGPYRRSRYGATTSDSIIVVIIVIIALSSYPEDVKSYSSDWYSNNWYNNDWCSNDWNSNDCYHNDCYSIMYYTRD